MYVCCKVYTGETAARALRLVQIGFNQSYSIHAAEAA